MATRGGYQEKIWASDQEATTAIRRAVRDSDGSEIKAAQLLGISYRSLSRYVTKLGLREELKRIGRGGREPHSAEGLPSLAAFLTKQRSR